MIFRTLGRIPPWTIALTYLVLIPTFAWWYDTCTNEFFHSTVKYEIANNRDARRILHDLQSTVRSGLRKQFHSNRGFAGNWEYNISAMNTSNLQAGSETVTFAVGVSLRARNRSGQHLGLTFPVRMSILYSLGRRDDKGGPVYLVPITFPTDRLLSAYLPKNVRFTEAEILPRVGAGAGSEGLIAISGDLRDGILDFFNGMNGFPSQLSDNYWRMLYFSAVTIATVGYGDIVPLTVGTRMAVSLEAILGVILAGLFINALFRQIALQALESQMLESGREQVRLKEEAELLPSLLQERERHAQCRGGPCVEAPGVIHSSGVSGAMQRCAAHTKGRDV